MSASHPTRRDFIAGTTKCALGAMILPRHLLGGPGFRAPSATLNIAIVGAGGMGMSNMTRLVAENIVALCDVDFPFVERSLEGRLRPREGPQVDATREAARMAESRKLQEIYTKAAKYADFREMLDKQKDIDAVVIATPDHTHAVIASAAMKAGKHVYVQKPLTYSVHEARALARLAKDTRVVTEMGNQGHSNEGTRRINELIAARDSRDGARGARLDRSPPAILGAGDSASRDRLSRAVAAAPAVRATAVERSYRGECDSQGDGDEPAVASARPELGSLPRSGEGGSISSGLPPVQLARVGGLWRQRDWRHGRSPHRSTVLGPRLDVSHDGRVGINRVGRAA